MRLRSLSREDLIFEFHELVHVLGEVMKAIPGKRIRVKTDQEFKLRVDRYDDVNELEIYVP